MTENFLLEENLNENFKGFLVKTILEPFINTFSPIIRFSPFSLKKTEELINNKDNTSIQKLSDMKSNTSINEIFVNNVKKNYFIKRINKGEYMYFPVPKLETISTNGIIQRGGQIIINNYDPKMPYYLGVAESLFKNNNYLTDNNYNTYNSYKYLLHYVLDEDQRNKLYQNFQKKTILLREQIKDNNKSIITSTVDDIQNNIENPKFLPEPLEFSAIRI